jgi:hypothetical protein
VSVLAPRALRNAQALTGTQPKDSTAVVDVALGREDAVLTSSFPEVPSLSDIENTLVTDYGVTLISGAGVWTAAEAAKVLQGLRYTPPWDAWVLQGCCMYRDGYAATTLGDTEASSHYHWVVAMDGTDGTPGADVRHIHFFDAAFRPREFYNGYAQVTVMHELGHVRMESGLVRQKRRVFLTGVEGFTRIYGGVADDAAALELEDQDPPEVRELVASLRDLWDSGGASSALKRMQDLADEVQYMWDYSQFLDTFGPESSPGQSWGPNVWKEWQRIMTALQGSVDAFLEQTRQLRIRAGKADAALRDMQVQNGEFRGALRAACTRFIRSCGTLFDETVRVLRSAVEYGGSTRYLEYFSFLAYRYGFRTFTPYSTVARVEWFAETYQLAALDPEELKRMNSGIATWFIDRQLTLPLHLQMFTDRDL